MNLSTFRNIFIGRRLSQFLSLVFLMSTLNASAHSFYHESLNRNPKNFDIYCPVKSGDFYFNTQQFDVAYQSKLIIDQWIDFETILIEGNPTCNACANILFKYVDKETVGIYKAEIVPKLIRTFQEHAQSAPKLKPSTYLASLYLVDENENKKIIFKNIQCFKNLFFQSPDNGQ